MLALPDKVYCREKGLIYEKEGSCAPEATPFNSNVMLDLASSQWQCQFIIQEAHTNGDLHVIYFQSGQRQLCSCSFSRNRLRPIDKRLKPLKYKIYSLVQNIFQYLILCSSFPEIFLLTWELASEPIPSKLSTFEQ